MAPKQDSTEKIYKLLLDMDQKIVTMDEKMVTNERLEEVKKEILYEVGVMIKSSEDKITSELRSEIEPMSKAQDKDSVAIIDLKRRVTSLEEWRAAETR